MKNRIVSSLIVTLFLSALWLGSQCKGYEVKAESDMGCITEIADNVINTKSAEEKQDVAVEEEEAPVEVSSEEVSEQSFEERKVAEVSSEEVQEPASEEPVVEVHKPRLRIPDVGIDVGLYDASWFDANQSQSIVNAKDSAAILSDLGQNRVIADHNNQGFNSIKGVVSMGTLAYIDYDGYTETYLCTSVEQGTNDGVMPKDSQNIRIVDRDGVSLAMYTCNEDWQHITVTYWVMQ